MTFNELQQRAQQKGVQLLRAKDSNGRAKSGYVVIRNGLWKRLRTLQAVAQYLSRL